MALAPGSRPPEPGQLEPEQRVVEQEREHELELPQKLGIERERLEQPLPGWDYRLEFGRSEPIDDGKLGYSTDGLAVVVLLPCFVSLGYQLEAVCFGGPVVSNPF